MADSVAINSTMIKDFPRGVIICGTDTDVGKTVISSLFVQGLNALYWKPIQSGSEDITDSEMISSLLKLEPNRIIEEVYKFKAPVSPHWAAEKESRIVDPELLQVPTSKETIVIETAGGLMVPLNRDLLQIDLLVRWNLPIILVARSGLGTLNHTLLSLEAMKKRHLQVLGIVLNGPLHKDNPQTLEQFGGVPIIAQVPTFKTLTSEDLSITWRNQQISKRLQNLIPTH